VVETEASPVGFVGLTCPDPEVYVFAPSLDPANKPTADLSAWGFAFENEQGSRVVLAQLLAQGTSVEDEVPEAMANAGIFLLVAPAYEARELITSTLP
jgi:hypothetical protein